MGLAFVPLTILAMSGVRETDSGLASGVMATAQQIGQAVGPRRVLTGLTRSRTRSWSPGRWRSSPRSSPQTSAIGRTGEPVPPRNFSGRQTKPNSRTPSAASSSR